eukprot:COSAG01_NODE_492_length_16335_cov_63.722284_2_plen_200_part_00
MTGAPLFYRVLLSIAYGHLFPSSQVCGAREHLANRTGAARCRKKQFTEKAPNGNAAEYLHHTSGKGSSVSIGPPPSGGSAPPGPPMAQAQAQPPLPPQQAYGQPSPPQQQAYGQTQPPLLAYNAAPPPAQQAYSQPPPPPQQAYSAAAPPAQQQQPPPPSLPPAGGAGGAMPPQAPVACGGWADRLGPALVTLSPLFSQ